MTTWVSMTRTGRGAGSNEIQIAAGNGRDAWTSQTGMDPPLPEVTTSDNWIMSRFAAALAWLNRWPEDEAGELSRYNAGQIGAGHFDVINVALVAVAHWGLETGWGVHEYNWNAGGIHCASAEGDCFREGEASGGEEFRSYGDFSAFADGYFTLISTRDAYESAWAAFKTGSANGIMRLWANDYTCGAKSKSEATALVARVRRVVAARLQVDEALPSENQIRATDNDVPNRCRPGSTNRGSPGRSGSGGSSGNTSTLLVAGLLGLALLSGKGKG